MARLLTWNLQYHQALGFRGIVMYVTPRDAEPLAAQPAIQKLLAGEQLTLVVWDEMSPIDTWHNYDLRVVQAHSVLSFWGRNVRVLVNGGWGGTTSRAEPWRGASGWGRQPLPCHCACWQCKQQHACWPAPSSWQQQRRAAGLCVTRRCPCPSPNSCLAPAEHDEFLIPGKPKKALPDLLADGCLADLRPECLYFSRQSIFPHNGFGSGVRQPEPALWDATGGGNPLRYYRFSVPHDFPKAFVDPNHVLPVSLHWTRWAGTGGEGGRVPRVVWGCSVWAGSSTRALRARLDVPELRTAALAPTHLACEPAHAARVWATQASPTGGRARRSCGPSAATSRTATGCRRSAATWGTWPTWWVGCQGAGAWHVWVRWSSRWGGPGGTRRQRWPKRIEAACGRGAFCRLPMPRLFSAFPCCCSSTTERHLSMRQP